MANPSQQANLNTLLKWGIENSSDPVSAVRAAAPPPSSSTTANDGTTTTTSDPSSGGAAAAPNGTSNSRLDPAILDALFGGPSDADLMKASMAAITDPSVSLDNKLVAFDNLEQLVESIDNANNLGALDLWSPLVRLLEDEEPKLRFMSAWCIGTAVQNNEKAQETAVVVGAVPKLVRLVVPPSSEQRPDAPADAAAGLASAPDSKDEKDVRRKACYAISSLIRNYQPGLKALVDNLPRDVAARYQGVDASDMNVIDTLMDELRSMGSTSS